MIALCLSILSLGISILGYANSVKVRVDAEKTALYKSRLDLLKAANTAQINWQKIVNDLYHYRDVFERSLRGEQLSTLKSAFDSWETEFVSSLENAKKMKEDIDGSFDEITKSDAEKFFRSIEVRNASLDQCREEMLRKFDVIDKNISKKFY